MSYNTYYSGSLEVTPPLTKKEVADLEQWLGHNENERIITDPDVIKHMVMEGWGIYTPWSPVDNFFENREHYGDHTYIEIESEGRYAGIVGILIYHLVKQIKEHTVVGDIFWDGDESDDLGKIIVKDGNVYLCDASVVYDKPTNENKITYGN